MTRPRAAVATLGRLRELDAKMAHGILRYCDHIVAVIDATYAGARLSQVLPYTGRDVPIVATIDEAVGLGADEVVLGASAPGGTGSAAVEALVADVLRRGLWLVHGLHSSFAGLAETIPDAHLVELRHVPYERVVATGAAAKVTSDVILTVGSDCAAGKMTTALEVSQGLRARGRRAAFVATGQTGMYIEGAGAPIDAVTADFTAGVVERLVLAAAEQADTVLVEGQGAILHPAYSGVTLSLLHGSAPNRMIFCHELGRDHLEYFEQSIEDLSGQIRLVETLAGAQRPANVIAVVAMSRGLDPMGPQAKRARAELSDSLGLPVFTPDADIGGLTELIDSTR